MSHKRRVCIICNSYECGGYGHGNIPDHEPDYMYEDEFYIKPEPQKCQICDKSIHMKNTDILDTEFYIIAGSYYEEPFIHGHDLEPVYYICMDCFDGKIEPIWKSKFNERIHKKNLKRVHREQRKRYQKNRKQIKKESRRVDKLYKRRSVKPRLVK